MRLTADLVEKSTSFINAVKDRELDLRGNRIPAIENFATIRDQYDTIDLTDNEIRKLENFPRMNRLRNLFVSNNQIVRVEEDVSKKLLALECLVLNGNKIEGLADLDGLGECKTLRYLSLMDNPVTKTQHYRLLTIAKFPWLRALDFRKITLHERHAAEDLASKGTTSRRNKTAASELQPTKAKRARTTALSEKERASIRQQILEADSFEEVARLEKLLESGYSL